MWAKDAPFMQEKTIQLRGEETPASLESSLRLERVEPADWTDLM